MRSWHEELADSIQTAAQLREKAVLSEAALPNLEAVINRYPMRIPPYYYSLIRSCDSADPIARMCIPSPDELAQNGANDTSGELENTPQAGLQHKYRQTALILASNTCAMYCRHCFRKRMVGLTDSELNSRVEYAAAYIKVHPEINNVLITGGDALMLPNWTLRRYLSELCKIDTLDLIRFGSRIPVVLPHRIFQDDELLDLFAVFSRKKAIYVVTQFNHPRELTPEAFKALATLQACGLQIRNQTVLLRGVNDDLQTLGRLLRHLTARNVAPYYVFQCRPVRGVKDRFQVPLSEGIDIINGAKGLQNGIGKSFRYAMSHPLGKIEILGKLSPSEGLFQFHQSKYVKDASRIFTAKLNHTDTWLDADLCGM